jgi:hypothetical protein
MNQELKAKPNKKKIGHGRNLNGRGAFMFTINRSRFILLSILVVLATVLSFFDVCYGQKKDQKKKEET